MTSLIRHLLSHLIFALIGLSLIGCPSSARATLAEDPRCAKLFSTLPPATLITPDSPEDDERAYALPTGEIRVFVKVIALNPRSSIETHLTLESADGSKGFLWDEKKRLFYVDARTGEYVLHATDPTGKEVSPARRIHAAADLPVIYVVVAPDASAYYRNGPLLVPLNLEPNYIAAFFPSQLPAIQAKDVSDMGGAARGSGARSRVRCAIRSKRGATPPNGGRGGRRQARRCRPRPSSMARAGARYWRTTRRAATWPWAASRPR